MTETSFFQTTPGPKLPLKGVQKDGTLLVDPKVLKEFFTEAAAYERGRISVHPEDSWDAGFYDALATVEEKVKAQMVDVRPEIRVWLRGTRETNEAHNQSLEAVLSLINELKKQS